MSGDYFFLPQEHVLFGPGSLARLGEEVKRIEAGRAFLITGRSLAQKTDFPDRIRRLLGPLLVGVFAEVRQHTPSGDVEKAAAAAQAAEADLLVSLGGGSPIDSAKAVARTVREATGRQPSHLAIPTTLSAAEFSHLVGVTDEARKEKTGFADARLTPRSVILDPELTLATPSRLWLSSGIRAVDHAVETLLAPGLHPISDAMALEAIERLFRWLPISQASPEDVAARGELQVAAWMSFFGEVNTPMGMSHILGRRIGARYDVPHGITSCITLPWVIEAQAARRPDPLAAIGRRLGLPGGGAAQAVRGLVQSLDLPSRLRDVGVPEGDLPSIAEAAYPMGKKREAALGLLSKMW